MFYPRRRMALFVAVLTLPGACERPVATQETRYACDAEGRLVVELYGGIRASLDWREAVLACEGMPRPNGQGARLRFAGPLGAAADERSVAFILGIPNLEEGRADVELPTNVTLVEEGTARFFGTQDTRSCWTDIEYQDPVGMAGARAYRISGILYCVSPLAELNGGSSISFSELEFTGRLDWNQPE